MCIHRIHQVIFVNSNNSSASSRISLSSFETYCRSCLSHCCPYHTELFPNMEEGEAVENIWQLFNFNKNPCNCIFLPLLNLVFMPEVRSHLYLMCSFEFSPEFWEAVMQNTGVFSFFQVSLACFLLMCTSVFMIFGSIKAVRRSARQLPLHSAMMTLGFDPSQVKVSIISTGSLSNGPTVTSRYECMKVLWFIYCHFIVIDRLHNESCSPFMLHIHNI